MKITTEEKMDKFRNMRAMIEDYKRLYSRYPTLKEYQEKLNMSSAVVIRYKRVILQEAKKKILDVFHNDMIIHIEKSLEAINENVEIFKKIRDDTFNDKNIIMLAAKNVLESHIDAVRIMKDAPDYLGLKYDDDKKIDNNVQDEQKYLYGQDDSEKIKDSIESMQS